MGTLTQLVFTAVTAYQQATPYAMSDAAPAKVAAKKKQAKPTHPPYAVMVVAAIKALKERSGSSKRNILKHIQANYKVGDQASIRLNIALRKLGKSGKLKQVKGVGARGSFRIPAPSKDGPKKPRGRPKTKKAGAKKAAKKPAAKKAAKKPVAKAAAAGVKKPRGRPVTKK